MENPAVPIRRLPYKPPKRTTLTPISMRPEPFDWAGGETNNGTGGRSQYTRKLTRGASGYGGSEFHDFPENRPYWRDKIAKGEITVDSEHGIHLGGKPIV